MMTKILVLLLNKAFESKMRKGLEPCIKNLYQKMATENLKVKSQMVSVKKGRIKYDVLFLETPEGKQKINLGRHWDKSGVILPVECN